MKQQRSNYPLRKEVRKIRKVKRLPVIVLFVLIALLLLVSCGKSEENVTTPGSTEAQITTEPEKSYAFLESPLCQEVENNVRHYPNSSFRHTPNCVEADSLVPVQIEIPKTVMINGRECALGRQYLRLGRIVGYEVETVDAYTKFSSQPVVRFDVVTGKIVGIFFVYLDIPDMGESLKIEEAYLVRARSAVKHHFPDVGIEQYVVDFNSVAADRGSGSIGFVKKIDGQRTSSWVSVTFNEGKVIAISLYNTDDFTDFDTALLDYDKEEHTHLIESFAEYVCNGYEPKTIERTETTLVKTADGDYAMEYQLRIYMDTEDEYNTSESFLFRIILQ